MPAPAPFTLNAGNPNGPRAGTFRLARGHEVKTPLFMPVGTQGAIRTLSPLHLESTGTQIVLANTYHLSQRPGEDIVKKAGGLHKFMAMDRPLLTDSGGFQVFSLENKELTEEGVTFRYEVDGQSTFLSPERSMQIQQDLGADIAMVFDECLPFGADRAYAERSVERTTRWERRSKEAHKRDDQSLFGIVQGGFWADLRQRSAAQIQDIGFDGIALGGLSVGEGHANMCDVLDWTMPHIRTDQARYLMGVGRPLDLVEGVARGIDMFDCVIATRHARSGMLYTNKGRMRLTDQRFRKDMYAPDTTCECYTCKNFSRAYLHHLLKVGEVLSATLCTLHNLHWFADFMERMRQSIVDDTFAEFRNWVHEVYPEDLTPKPVAGVVPGTPKPSAKPPARSGWTGPSGKPGGGRR